MDDSRWCDNPRYTRCQWNRYAGLEFLNLRQIKRLNNAHFDVSVHSSVTNSVNLDSGPVCPRSFN